MRFVPTCLFLLLTLSLSGGGAAIEAQGLSYVNGVGIEFVLIPAGTFMMGIDEDPENPLLYFEETPRHKVTITKPFYLGKYEVTQEQWKAVMGTSPSGFQGAANPVEQVSWDDIQVFIARLNHHEGHDRYRLPTEAEWEYAARAGSTGAYSFGDDEGKLGRYAWYGKNSDGRTHPVGQKEPNAWGLYDMHGNVLEWVQDLYGYYSKSPAVDPKGPAVDPNESMRRYRGCSWDTSREEWCHVTRRGGCPPTYRGGDEKHGKGVYTLGFRLALSLE